ncbi:Protein HOL1-like protein 2 [Botrytis cinerea]
MVGWGVLQDPRYPNIPGTVNLGENTAGADGSSKEGNWDYVEPKKRGEIVLNPQPSESPNDPLNWTTATKMAILLILALTAGVTVSLGPMITTGSEDIATAFDVSTDQVSFNIVGIMQLTTGSGTFFTAAAAAVWGKRPVFIISTIGLLATNIWGFFSNSFMSLSIMRAVQGFCASPSRHSSALRFPRFSLCMKRSTHRKFHYPILRIQIYFWNLRLHIRPDHPRHVFLRTRNSLHSSNRSPTQLIVDKTEGRVYEIVLPDMKKSFTERLSIFNGRISQASFWALAVKPIPLVTFPAVIFSAFTYSFYAAGLTLIALLQDTVFSAPPYNLSTSAIGLTNLPLFGVGLVGTLVSGYCADFVVQWMTRHNNGVYEPEFRLVLMFVAASLSTVAYIGFGYSVAAGASIYVPIAFLGVQTFAVPFATSSMFTYVMDCHNRLAPQAFVTMNFIKAVLSLVMSDFVNGWFEASGAKSVFTTVAIANLAVSAFAIPMYIFGKRLRSKVARSAFHQKF